MKRGFTLIELLAVIVILSIILVIAVPQILKVVEDSRTNSYNNQIKLVEGAAKTYHVSNSLNFINNQAIITISDLQSSGLIESNIKDPRTGNALPTSSYVLVTKNGEEYNYNYGYDTNGLILYYDGIYNGGLNIHNDNTSANKGIWEDLSGNNNDGTLTNFAYTSASGWVSNSLKFDGTSDYLTSSTISQYTNESYTLEIVLSIDAYSYKELKFGVTELKLRTLGSNDYWNIYNNLWSYVATNVSYSNQLPLNTNAYYSFSYSSGNNNCIYYKNNTKYTRSVSSFIKPNMVVSFNDSSEGMNGNIYAVRIYNRALTDAEMQHNYEIDKLRFGI